MKYVKRITAFILSIFIIGCCSSSLAAPRTMDLSTMTVNELDALIDEIKVEKKAAIEFDNDTYKLLAADFEELVAGVAPENKEITLPFLGLNKERERECYELWGDCKIKFNDDSELKLKNAHAIYLYDKDSKSYRHVAFYTDEKVYYCDEALLVL